MSGSDHRWHDRGLPGLTATVLSTEVGVWSGTAGTADGTADGTAELEATSRLGIASLTKTSITAQVMQLAERPRSSTST